MCFLFLISEKIQVVSLCWFAEGRQNMPFLTQHLVQNIKFTSSFKESNHQNEKNQNWAWLENYINYIVF